MKPINTRKTIMNYLTEKRLADVMSHTYDIIRDRAIPDSNSRMRPDIRIDSTETIIEFDGFRHYNNSIIIANDQKKDLLCTNLGYDMIRIPYFIQMCPELCSMLNIPNVDIEYPHGFIDSKALLPCDFCELGILKFKSNLITFSFCHSEIIESIKEKISKIGKQCVLPPSLFYLVD